jgi:hypothetical protein
MYFFLIAVTNYFFRSPSLHYQTRFGSTDDINTKDIIMYELECDGQEESIMKCKRQEWMDVCQGDLCSCYDKDDFRGVRCRMYKDNFFSSINKVLSIAIDKNILRANLK